MPNFFSNIPGLSAIPNPLNLFNGDDSHHSSNSSRETNPSSSTDAMSPGPSKPTASKIAPILEDGRAERVLQAHKASGTSIVIAESDTADSDSPRSQRSLDGRPRGLSVASAYTTIEGGRPRGMSNVSGATGDSGGRRRRPRFDKFVLCKPPPTTAKNPLNLQVQLVVEKRTRPRRGSDSVQRTVQSNGELSSTPSTPQRQSYEKLADETEKATPASKAPVPPADSIPGVEPVSTAPTTKPKRSNSVGSAQSSVAGSTSSTSSGVVGKRIVPLYNLAVHNVVQPTIVTDAGTDSRVAKFSKRQLDIAGVGILEPAEVWLPHPGQFASPRPSSDAPRGRPASMISTMSSLTPATSRVDDPKRQSVDVNSQEDGAKKFFGKIFRKRSAVESPVGNPKALASRSNIGGFQELEPQLSLQVPVPSSPQLAGVHFPGDPLGAGQIGHPTFGLAPNVLTRRTSEVAIDDSGAIVGLTNDMVSETNIDQTVSLWRSARPVGYTWTVRRWAKKNTDGWAAHLVAAAAAGLDLVGGSLPGDNADDVVFEWVKLRITPNGPEAEAVLKNHLAADQLDIRKKPGPPSIASARPSPAASRTNLSIGRRKTTDTLAIDTNTGTSNAPAKSMSKIFRRASISPAVRRGSKDTADVIVETTVVTPATPTLVTPATGNDPSVPSTEVTSSGSASDDEEGQDLPASIVEDEEYDSDPEDSETPWQCSVWVKATGQRQLIATLTPTPHHPMVIGMLRIPTGLRSVCLTDLGKNKAVGKDCAAVPTRISTMDLAQRVREEVALTEENLKDVIAVTAMWLVAREEFGGLGAKRGKR